MSSFTFLLRVIYRSCLGVVLAAATLPVAGMSSAHARPEVVSSLSENLWMQRYREAVHDRPIIFYRSMAFIAATAADPRTRPGTVFEELSRKKAPLDGVRDFLRTYAPVLGIGLNLAPSLKRLEVSASLDFSAGLQALITRVLVGRGGIDLEMQSFVRDNPDIVESIGRLTFRSYQATDEHMGRLHSLYAIAQAEDPSVPKPDAAPRTYLNGRDDILAAWIGSKISQLGQRDREDALSNWGPFERVLQRALDGEGKDPRQVQQETSRLIERVESLEGLLGELGAPNGGGEAFRQALREYINTVGQSLPESTREELAKRLIGNMQARELRDLHQALQYSISGFASILASGDPAVGQEFQAVIGSLADAGILVAIAHLSPEPTNIAAAFAASANAANILFGRTPKSGAALAKTLNANFQAILARLDHLVKRVSVLEGELRQVKRLIEVGRLESELQIGELAEEARRLNEALRNDVAMIVSIQRTEVDRDVALSHKRIATALLDTRQEPFADTKAAFIERDITDLGFLATSAPISPPFLQLPPSTKEWANLRDGRCPICLSSAITKWLIDDYARNGQIFHKLLVSSDYNRRIVDETISAMEHAVRQHSGGGNGPVEPVSQLRFAHFYVDALVRLGRSRLPVNVSEQLDQICANTRNTFAHFAVEQDLVPYALFTLGRAADETLTILEHYLGLIRDEIYPAPAQSNPGETTTIQQHWRARKDASYFVLEVASGEPVEIFDSAGACPNLDMDRRLYVFRELGLIAEAERTSVIDRRGITSGLWNFGPAFGGCAVAQYYNVWSRSAERRHEGLIIQEPKGFLYSINKACIKARGICQGDISYNCVRAGPDPETLEKALLSADTYEGLSCKPDNTATWAAAESVQREMLVTEQRTAALAIRKTIFSDIEKSGVLDQALERLDAAYIAVEQLLSRRNPACAEATRMMIGEITQRLPKSLAHFSLTRESPGASIREMVRDGNWRVLKDILVEWQSVSKAGATVDAIWQQAKAANGAGSNRCVPSDLSDSLATARLLSFAQERLFGRENQCTLPFTP
ncbi:hypothetical protein [Microvirga sp. Mcv34]|uniref:hypothetical protein n=1 Tax=Microvirga sp. Mcv34 TaxID=2926016 RepID=UPI0021C7ABAB|nr:hypothetical protein [Microvirga sp. Mcv34]